MKSKYLFTIVACATLFLILSSCASSFHKVKHRGIPKIRFHQQSSEELISNNADILNEETPEKENMKESDLYIKESQDLDKFEDSSIRESPNKQAESRHCTDKNLLDENVQEVQIKL